MLSAIGNPLCTKTSGTLRPDRQFQLFFIVTLLQRDVKGNFDGNFKFWRKDSAHFLSVDFQVTESNAPEMAATQAIIRQQMAAVLLNPAARPMQTAATRSKMAIPASK